MNSKLFSWNLLIDSEIFEKDAIAAFKLIQTLKTDKISTVLSGNLRFFQEFDLNGGLKSIPIYNVLRDNPEFTENLSLAQIDYNGEIIHSYFCPNNPKLDELIEKTFKSYDKSNKIAGIQLDGLEMPSHLANMGCFCKYCCQQAVEKQIDIDNISQELSDLALKKHNGVSITKQFPDWIKFRTKSVTDLAGRLIIILRKINPELSLGLDINFSKNPELIGQDYFFLALFLDSLNFNIDQSLDSIEKKLLKQIRLISKKFLGDIEVNLQVKVPTALNGKSTLKLIRKIEKFSFDGLVFQVFSIEELEKLVTI